MLITFGLSASVSRQAMQQDYFIRRGRPQGSYPACVHKQTISITNRISYGSYFFKHFKLLFIVKIILKKLKNIN